MARTPAGRVRGAHPASSRGPPTRKRAVPSLGSQFLQPRRSRTTPTLVLLHRALIPSVSSLLYSREQPLSKVGDVPCLRWCPVHLLMPSRIPVPNNTRSCGVLLPCLSP